MLAREVSPNRWNEMIEEHIDNVVETTNGAKELMSDTCASNFYQPPINGGGLPLRGTVQ